MWLKNRFQSDTCYTEDFLSFCAKGSFSNIRVTRCCGQQLVLWIFLFIFYIFWQIVLGSWKSVFFAPPLLFKTRNSLQLPFCYSANSCQGDSSGVKPIFCLFLFFVPISRKITLLGHPLMENCSSVLSFLWPKTSVRFAFRRILFYFYFSNLSFDKLLCSAVKIREKCSFAHSFLWPKTSALSVLRRILSEWDRVERL